MDRGSAVAPEPLILRALGPAAGPVLLSRLTPRQSSGLPTVLVSMPFMDAGRPSIQLGLLTAIARAQGFPVESLHANLDFAARIGIDYYKRISEHRGAMLGDWLFSREAFLDQAPDVDGRLIDDLADDLPRGSGSAADAREKLLRMRDTDVPRYLDDLVDEILSGGARVVGFSSTFQQNAASFALARRLKQRRPDIVTIFGGANFDGEMGPEFLRVLDFIDYAVVGEGDLAFPRMLAALAAGTDPGLVPGVARRVDGDVGVTSPEPPFDRMDDLPAPDYAEYFRRAQALGLITAKAHRNTPIPFESSRGCWWGAKHHCTFCGLNGSSMAFRSKSADRVAQELAELTRRYHSFSFEAVDNIMDVNHLKSLLPTLINDRTDYRIFYEVKANLTRDQIRMMAQAGITAIQPGLESMSSRVLSLMRKGVRAAQNINVLRWALYYGIDVSWNILWGFPGESEQDYVEQATVLGHLTHLQPPTSAGPIWMERFSPLFSNSDEFPMRYRATRAQLRLHLPRIDESGTDRLLLRVRAEGPIAELCLCRRRPGGSQLVTRLEGGKAARPDLLVGAGLSPDLRRSTSRQRGHIYLRRRGCRDLPGLLRPSDQRVSGARAMRNRNERGESPRGDG